MASPSTDQFRINATSLAEKFLTSLGITCMIAEPVPGRADRVRLITTGVHARKHGHPKIWLRSLKEAARIEKELMAGCKHAHRGTRGHLVIDQPANVAIDLARAACQLHGFRPIREEHLTVTFDSVLARLKKQLDALQRAGVIARLKAEYGQLLATHKAAGTSGTRPIAPFDVPSIVPGGEPVAGSEGVLTDGTIELGQSRDNGTSGTNSIPEYLDWVVSRLVTLAPLRSIHKLVIDSDN